MFSSMNLKSWKKHPNGDGELELRVVFIFVLAFSPV